MKKKILVVDDEEDILTLVEKVLVYEEYAIFLARNGEELFEIIKDNKPDLILLDIMMPGMDGFSICRRLKAKPATRDIPVIMLTVLSSRMDINRGIAAGAAAFLTKPFDPEKLNREIKAVLERNDAAK
jgi:two-component system phosphate regulon response regulator PhoB